MTRPDREKLYGIKGEGLTVWSQASRPRTSIECEIKFNYLNKRRHQKNRLKVQRFEVCAECGELIPRNCQYLINVRQMLEKISACQN